MPCQLTLGPSPNPASFSFPHPAQTHGIVPSPVPPARLVPLTTGGPVATSGWKPPAPYPSGHLRQLSSLRAPAPRSRPGSWRKSALVGDNLGKGRGKILGAGKFLRKFP